MEIIMKNFKYKAKKANHEFVEGVISAKNRKEVINIISNQGLYLIECEEFVERDSLHNDSLVTKWRQLYNLCFVLILVGILLMFLRKSGFINIGIIILIIGFVGRMILYVFCLHRGISCRIKKRK